MPLRDFSCTDCGLEHRDVLVARSNQPTCEGCGSAKVQMVFTFPSNYTIAGNNSASSRPARMGGKK